MTQCQDPWSVPSDPRNSRKASPSQAIVPSPWTLISGLSRNHASVIVSVQAPTRPSSRVIALLRMRPSPDGCLTGGDRLEPPLEVLPGEGALGAYELGGRPFEHDRAAVMARARSE